MTAQVRSYLAECFWPGVTPAHLEELDARAVRVTSDQGAVRYLGSMLTQQDEVVFCFFEGFSASAVELTARRAKIPFARVIESTGLPTLATPARSPHPHDLTPEGPAMTDPNTPWLPASFRHPERVELRWGEHLRPIRADDVEIDYPAVMGSRERLWEKYGAAWGWPPANMTPEQDRDDLAHHEREIASHESFNYAVLNSDESALLGCVYIDPPDDAETCDALVSWWVIDDLVGSRLELELERFIPQWVTTAWPFERPRFHP